MGGNTVRHFITTGRLTIFYAYAIAATLWTTTAFSHPADWVGFICLAACTYLLHIVYNKVSLIRARSWFLPSSFIVLCGAMPFLHAFDWSCVALILFLTAQHFLLNSYQNYHPERSIYHVFLFIALASLFVPQFIFLGVAVIIAMQLYLRSLTLRAFVSIFLALITMALFSLAAAIVSGHIQDLQEHYLTLCDINFGQVLSWSTQRLVNVLFVVFLITISIIHYGKTSYNDKISVRMFFYLIILETLCALFMLLGYPHAFDAMFRLTVLQAAPLTARLFVLGKGRFLDFFFIVTLLAVVALTIYNL